MSAPKWTPGPWEYDAENGRILGPPHEHPQAVKMGIVLADSRPIVAYVRGYHGGKEADANGHKLAAAPEMYEALAEMVETFKGYQGMELTAARAALAKARGGS